MTVPYHQPDQGLYLPVFPTKEYTSLALQLTDLYGGSGGGDTLAKIVFGQSYEKPKGRDNKGTLLNSVDTVYGFNTFGMVLVSEFCSIIIWFIYFYPYHCLDFFEVFPHLLTSHEKFSYLAQNIQRAAFYGITPALWIIF